MDYEYGDNDDFRATREEALNHWQPEANGPQRARKQVRTWRNRAVSRDLEDAFEKTCLAVDLHLRIPVGDCLRPTPLVELTGERRWLTAVPEIVPAVGTNRRNSHNTSSEARRR